MRIRCSIFCIDSHLCLVHCRVQTLSPKVAAIALRALDTFVTEAVRCGKALEADWGPLFTVIPFASLCFCPTTRHEQLVCRVPDVMHVVFPADAHQVDAGATGGGCPAECASRECR